MGIAIAEKLGLTLVDRAKSLERCRGRHVFAHVVDLSEPRSFMFCSFTSSCSLSRENTVSKVNAYTFLLAQLIKCCKLSSRLYLNVRHGARPIVGATEGALFKAKINVHLSAAAHR